MRSAEKILGGKVSSGVWRVLGLWFCLTALAAARLQAADDRIVYAPDVVGVDRMFMIALKVPAESPEVAVAVPDGRGDVRSDSRRRRSRRLAGSTSAP